MSVDPRTQINQDAIQFRHIDLVKDKNFVC